MQDAGGFFPAEGCSAADGSDRPWHKPDPDDPGLDYPDDAFSKGMHAWLPTWVEPDDIAWAVSGTGYRSDQAAGFP